MNAYFATLRTPFGPFSYAVDVAGAVTATAFGDDVSLRQRLTSRGVLVRDIRAGREARTQLQEYFAGTRSTFSLTLATSGTSFQQQVWAELQRIPCGETRTYGEIAAAIGRPAASRAVGRANATNPICVIVPCHRVIGADGSLTGFAFGEPIKRRLLQHEGFTR